MWVLFHPADPVFYRCREVRVLIMRMLRDPQKADGFSHRARTRRSYYRSFPRDGSQRAEGPFNVLCADSSVADNLSKVSQRQGR